MASVRDEEIVIFINVTNQNCEPMSTHKAIFKVSFINQNLKPETADKQLTNSSVCLVTNVAINLIESQKPGEC